MDFAEGLITFFAGALCILTGAAELFSKKRAAPRILRALLYAVPGLLLTEFYLTHQAGLTADMALYPGQTAVFLFIRLMKYSLGPLLYFYYISATGYRRFTLPRLLPHFLCQLAAWCAGAVYFLSALTGAESITALRRVLWIITDAGFAHIAVYIFASMLHASGQNAAGRENFYKRILIGCAAAGITAGVLLLVYRVTGNSRAETFAPFILSTAVIGWIFFLQIRPDIMEKFIRAEKEKSYRHSLLKGSDAEMMRSRLYDLMENEKVFCDEDLSLDRLASMLSVSKHLLSELLNTVIKSTFSDFVNGYRIRETERIFADEPGRSILSAAFAAGFNSKSVFYSAFKKQKGISPVRYRAMMREAAK
ncbi:MAG: helix-turn-helix domain-containing protein [Spirochaetota bacterium]